MADQIDPASITFLQALAAVLDVPAPANHADQTAYLTTLQDRVTSVRTSITDLLADPSQGLDFDTQWLHRRAREAVSYPTQEQPGGDSRG